MITDTSHFKQQFEKIFAEVDNDNVEIHPLKSYIIKDFSEKNIKKRYRNIFQVFPYEIETASTTFAISIFSTEILDLYHHFSDYTREIEPDKIKAITLKRNDFTTVDQNLTLTDYIEEYFHSLVYWYEKVLKNTKKYHFFANIQDEKVILMNLLTRYKSVLADDTKQIYLFFGIGLTKSVSDIVVSMLVEFIEERLKILLVKVELDSFISKSTYINNNNKKIEWLGTQQEFCELLIELIEKNWIENIEDGDRKAFINTISSNFEFSASKRNKTSDHTSSLYQIFKGEHNKNQRFYPFLEKPNYKKKFNSILANNKNSSTKH